MPTVSRDDLRRVLGELDDPKIIDILALNPSLADLEEAPRVTDVLPALADAGSIVAPRIVGSVTRELLGTAKLERATFRFRRARPRK